jgi:hypothetical protein
LRAPDGGVGVPVIDALPQHAAATSPERDKRQMRGEVVTVAMVEYARFPRLRFQLDRFRVVELAHWWGCSTNLHL